MVCRADRTYLIPCICSHIFVGKLPPEKVPVRVSTSVKDLYDYIEEQCQIQQDTFKLHLYTADLVQVDLSEMKDKTLSEVGINFDSEQELLTELKESLVMVGTDFTVTKDHKISVQKKARFHSRPESFYSQSSYKHHLSPYHPLARGEEGDDDVDLESLLKSSETNYVGLVNQAMTCYLNSLLQSLYMTPEFRNALYNWEYVEGSEKDEANSIPYQLQKLFLNLQTSTKAAVKTTALTKSFGWDSTEAWQQHDIQELCRVMFDALEQKFKNTEQSDLISRFYEGTMIDYVKCLECGTEKSRPDTFLDIPLPVRPFGSSETYSSVEEALRAFVQYEILEGNNQYHCDKCNKKCDAHKGLKFTKFPYLLTIHLKRFDFDFETFHRIKLNNKVTFPDILNLNPFITSAPVLNGESLVTKHDENVASSKSDDNSIANSATLDGSPASDSDLPNSLSNHMTTLMTTTTETGTETPTPTEMPVITPTTTMTTTKNQDQDDDEGIGIGPSTSNGIAHNNCENEKKNDEKIAEKGPYNYELFSIMIHSGSASGGHYYAYIKDFRTQEWLCFNDQSVTQITEDDIQKTYGGGSTRSYFSGGSSSTSAYMLMYRQIDPARNALPMEVQDFPKHIQELLEKMKDSDRRENKKINIEMKDVYKGHGLMTVYCQRPNEDKKQDIRIFVFMPEQTWAEMTEDAYKDFALEGIVNLDQCRLVAYDPATDTIVQTFDGKEQETFSSLWSSRSQYSLLLQIRGIVTTVYVVDVGKKRLEALLNLRTLFPQTIREYKQTIGKHLNLKPDEMKLVLRKEEAETVLVQNEDAQLTIAEFSSRSKVFACIKYDPECNKSFFESTISAIADRLETVITLSIKLPVISKEKLEVLNIPMLEEPCKEKEKEYGLGDDIEMKTEPAAESASKTDSNDASNACTTASEQHQFENNASKSSKRQVAVDNNKSVGTARNASPHESAKDNEEWHTPEQSNSEDGSLSDSDKTLDGDVPEDDQLQLSYLPSNSAKNPLIDMLNQVAFEHWDVSECYFKASLYTNHNTKFLKVIVDKRMTFHDLNKHLEPYVGIPSEYFKICHEDEFGITEAECTNVHNWLSDNLLDGENLSILVDPVDNRNPNRKCVVEVYGSNGSRKQLNHFLFECVVKEDLTAGQLKKEILAEMKTKYNIDIPYNFCQLLEFTYMVKIEDHQKIKKFDFGMESRLRIFVKERKQQVSSDEEEPVTNSNLITVQRWFPKENTLGPRRKISLNEMTVEELVKTLSKASNIPEKHIEIARKKRLFTTVDPPNRDQFPDVQNIQTWIGLSSGTWSRVELGKRNVFMYKDNRDDLPQPQQQQEQEQEQQQQQQQEQEQQRESQKDYNELLFDKGVIRQTRYALYDNPMRYLPVSSAPSPRYNARKEKALKIHLDDQ